jgi:hypothetical protein
MDTIFDQISDTKKADCSTVNDFPEFLRDLSFLFLEMHIRRNLAPPTLEHIVQLKLLAVFWIGDKMGQQKVDVTVSE